MFKLSIALTSIQLSRIEERNRGIYVTIFKKKAVNIFIKGLLEIPLISLTSLVIK